MNQSSSSSTSSAPAGAPSMPTPLQMCLTAGKAMETKALRPAGKTFLLSLLGGFFIAAGFVYCAIGNTAGVGKIVSGMLFSLGLMMVITLGADLFTSTTMTLIPFVRRQVSLSRMFGNWCVVYAGNFVGALFLVGLILASGHPWSGGGAIAQFYMTTSIAKLSHTFTEAVFLGILCNIMVCLAVWLSYGGRSLIEKMVACVLPVGLFVAGGFEHSVANMFMIPMGIFCSQLMPADLAARMGDSVQVLTWSGFVVKNLIPVTIGNIIGGGLIVGLGQWFIHMGGSEAK